MGKSRKNSSKRKIRLPGRLMSKGNVILHTKAAVSLFYGERQEYYLPGIYYFVGVVKRVFYQTGKDNPYADSFLIELERLLDTALQKLEEQNTAGQERQNPRFFINSER